MKNGIIGLIFAITLLFNSGEVKAQNSPEANALIIIADRMANTLSELSTASLNYELKKIPGLIFFVETDLVRLERAYKKLSSTEKALLGKDFQVARDQVLDTLKKGHNLMKLLGQK